MLSDVTKSDITKQLSKIWAQMSSTDKMPYLAKHEEACEIYERAMEEYNVANIDIPNKTSRLSN